MLAASIIFLLLVGGIAGTTWGLIRADRARKAEADRAEGETKANAQAQKRLQQIEKGSEILASVFGDLDPRAEEKEGRPLRAILGDRLDRAAADLEGDAVGDPLVVANLQDRLGRTYRALGHAAKAKALFTKALAIRRAQLGPDHADTLAVMSQQASALKDVGELNECHRPATSRCGTPRCGFSGPIIGTPSPPGTTWPWRTGRPGGRARPAPCWNRSETPC